MIVYYIVILWVVVFSGIAEQIDMKQISINSNTTESTTYKDIPHTINACYAYILSSLFMVFVGGMRYYVGADYGGYYNRWYLYAEELTESILNLDEPGYRVICAIFKFLKFNDGAYPVFTASAITIGLTLLIIYYNSDHLCLTSILFLFLYWSAGFNAVRQCLAATFVFCGYKALRDKKLWIYIIWISIAFLFHRSAICMIFPYFFIHSEISIKNLILIVLGCIVFLHSYDYAFDFTGAILDKEFNLEETGSYNLKEVNRFRIIFHCVPAAFFYIWTIIQKSNISQDHVFKLNILLFNAAISLSAMNSPYLSRMGIYFSPFIILAYCGLINDMPPKYHKILRFAISIYCGLFFLYGVHNSSSLRYFHFIWER